MSENNYWLLPEGIEEALPEEAEYLEQLRRRLLDMYATWGYRLVMPPLAEYLESLLSGAGRKMELQTFKLTDQLNGRLMGVRADMTPQVARIDAHRLKSEHPTRLCYMGTVLRARADHFSSSRSPLQTGIELFGHQGVDSDFEVIALMLETLRLCGVPLSQVHLDLGHVGIYRGLAQQAEMSEQDECLFFEKLQRKSIPEIEQWLGERCGTYSDTMQQMLRALPELNGDSGVLIAARDVLSKSGAAVQQALDDLQALTQRVQAAWPEVELNLDLAELRGYDYHTGAIYAAYRVGRGYEIARGGRYDGIGAPFGKARPATGFSADLKILLHDHSIAQQKKAIFAPAEHDSGLEAYIMALRAQGEIVIRELNGQTVVDPVRLGCDRRLVRDTDDDSAWQLKDC